jgi:hypothetical protein
MRILYWLVLFSVPVWLSAQVIPPALRVDWTTAGYEGRIPNPELIVDVKSFGAAGNGTVNDWSAITGAIGFLAGRCGVIHFPAGDYLILAPLSLPDSVILRGEGADQTRLLFNLGDSSLNCINVSRVQSGAWIPLTGSIQKGSSVVHLPDASSFVVNDHAEIREENGSWDCDPASWAAYSVGQVVKITGKGEGILTLDHPLRIGLDSILHPAIRAINAIREAGIECLRITRLDSLAATGYNIDFEFADNCWVKGVESCKSIGSHIAVYTSTNLTVKGCYFHESYLYDGTSTRGYGITLNCHCGEILVEDNIFRHLRHAMMVKTGANGNVFAYNYSVDPVRSEPIPDFSGDISLHGHYAFANLFEGNICQNIIIDHYWGPSGPWNTFFRNRAELYGIIMTTGTIQTCGQNLAGNEVTNTGPLYGMYLLTGTGHFAFGNNISGTISPSGTTELPDTSYYLLSRPAFWTLPAALPVIGIPTTINTGTIPARERYRSGAGLTVCADTANGIEQESVPGFDPVSISPNPFTDRIVLSFLNRNNDKDFGVEIADISGKLLLKANFPLNPGSNRIMINLKTVTTPGLYLVYMKTESIRQVRKIIKAC